MNNKEFKKGIIFGIIIGAIIGLVMTVIMLNGKSDKDRIIEENPGIIVRENQIEPTFELQNQPEGPSDKTVEEKMVEHYDLIYDEQAKVYRGTTKGKQEFTTDGYWDGVVYNYYTDKPGGDRFYADSNISGLAVVTIPSTEYEMDPFRFEIKYKSGVEINSNKLKFIISETWDDYEYIGIGIDIMNNNYGTVYPYVYGVKINENYELDYKNFAISHSDSSTTLDLELSKTDIAKLGIVHVDDIEFEICMADDLDEIGDDAYSKYRVYSTLTDNN